MPPSRSRFRRAVVALALSGLSACVVLEPPGYDDFQDAVKHEDPIRIYDTLEVLIAEGDDSRGDRKEAFRAVRDRNVDTAEFHFVWAALAGRYVQYKGLLAADLLKDIERHAIRSRELDPDYRGGAAVRLLGTLYVVAPSAFVEHGDSETGLEMLEGLVEKYPDDPENHMRVAEAYISLGDPGPAAPHLCFCLAVRDTMRKDSQQLVDSLVADAGEFECEPAAGAPAKK